ncbi:MAG: PAS domain S-box protein, partial [Deltaproteobacteria bacterium]|nr:PAS domain S-box protein [Deltaproteobacteria bacterium]
MLQRRITINKWLGTILALSLVVLSAGGVWFYRHQEQTTRQEAEGLLAAIARLKADQIANWRQERRADAAQLMEHPLMPQLVAQFLAQPQPQLQEPLLKRFRSLQTHRHYSDIFLVDAQGQVRLSLTGALDSHQEYAPALAAAWRRGLPEFTELHVDEDNTVPHISVVAPFFTREQDGKKPLGALILVSDASQFLYPLIQSWPIPSQTAETLLVRREGDEVLYLNDLRHQPGAALKLRFPLTRTEIPAVQAALGRVGIVQTSDYRGVEVLAYIQPIPDSPWLMVAKKETQEVFALWRFRSRLILALVISVIALAGFLGLVVWQNYEKAHYQELYRAEAALRAGEMRHSLILSSIGDAVIATDAVGRVEFLNPVAEQLTGWKDEEARGRPLGEVFHIVNEETRELVENPVDRVLREGIVVGLANHTLLIARDGVEHCIADSGAPIRTEQGDISGVVLVFQGKTSERLAQRMTEIRLALIKYAAHHTLDELMQKALDDIADLVHSPIGFFHFVEEDQKTLSLQQWSSRTLREFCRAEGKGRHYGIDQAGVWVDCVYEKKPVIHNDYEALPHKKGTPRDMRRCGG